MLHKTLSSGLEDYLECIYNEILENGSVKAIQISRDLNVSRASVTDALQRLAEGEYINYERYGSIAITKKGELKAKEVIEKHNILTSFFKEILMLSDDEATENACRIEHVITQNAFNKLKEYTTKNLEKQ
jgi:Mn-dependent DtxR family transcriptional regulator